ncbi:hypothetical protein [Entomohabitans teleogrylli]|uniref:hypothetical protein n=1 Tax=Entomohabitans teleogrylli TaxID=1384589 RepID=UPI00073D4823|nr:hypothetical protein [Entomohabitans teleogrylli]
MAQPEHHDPLSQPAALRVLTIHLASWRYLSALTLPPLLQVVLAPSPGGALLLGLILLAHYFCWRLWLDERLFRVLRADHASTFDAALAALWKTTPGAAPRTMAQRWQGARRLLRQALGATLALWALWLLMLCFPA